MLYLGTSGWSIRAWMGRFYPSDVRGPAILEEYATAFNAVEIHATAYQAPNIDFVKRWRDRVPHGFCCAMRLWRDISHRRGLHDCDHEVALFIEAMRYLDDRRGPLLIQLPPSFHPDQRLLGDFLDRLHRRIAEPGWRIAIEFRDPGWISGKTRRLLDDRNVAWCLGDMPNCSVRTINGASFTYLRRHGPYGTYTDSYSSQRMLADVCMVRNGIALKQDVYVFFNNTIGLHAIHDANRLQALIAGAV